MIQVGGRADSPERVLQLVAEIAEQLDVDLVLDEACRRRLAETQVFICGTHSLRRSELIEWLAAILSFSDVALIPVEREATNARPQWEVIDQRER